MSKSTKSKLAPLGNIYFQKILQKRREIVFFIKNKILKPCSDLHNQQLTFRRLQVVVTLSGNVPAIALLPIRLTIYHLYQRYPGL